MNQEDVLARVRAVRHLYWELGRSPDDDLPVPLIEIILPTVSRMRFGDPWAVGVGVRSWDPRKFLGYLATYPKHAEIWVLSVLNICWRRLVVAKELSHLLCRDDETARTDGADALIADLLMGTASPAAAAESLALTTAIEILVPWHHLGRFDSMSAEPPRKVAEVFRVPEPIIMMCRIPAVAERRRECHRILDETEPPPPYAKPRHARGGWTD